MIRRRRNDEEDEYEDIPPQTSGPVVIDYEEYYVAPPPPVYVEPQTTTAVTPSPAPAPASPPSTTTALATTPARPATVDMQDSIEAIRLLTALAVGGTIEGADQLVTRLREYEQELEVLAAAEAAQRAARGQLGEVLPDEDELDRLRFAMVGFIFDAQARLGQGIYSAARLADSTLETAGNVSKPFRNFFLFRPVTSRVEKRVDGLVAYGRESIDRWTATGRDLEPRSRALATRTYEEIVAEIINMLAENEEIKDLVASQGISLVEEVRDNVRGRTVTGDSVIEDLARRILRRTPREDLPEPPAEVQRWAGIRVSSEQTTEDTTS